MFAPHEVYDRIIAPHYPSDEIDPLDVFLSDAESGFSCILTAEHGGELAAAAVVYGFAGADLLGYMAVLPEHRSKKIGAALVQDAIARSVARGVPLVAEIERPDRHDSHPLYGDPDRRVQFYAEHGGLVLDIPFFQPPTAPGRSRKYGMLLVRLDPTDERKMLTPAVRAFVDDYLGEPDLEVGEEIALRAALSVSDVRLIPLASYVGVLTP